MAALDIRLLGGMRLEHQGSAAEDLPPRAKGLVAYLLLHRDGPHPRARLAYLLWPDSDEAQARTNLRQTLHHLRRSLPEAERFVALSGQHLRWRREGPYHLDVARFEDAVARAAQARAAGEGEQERACLEEAVRLYRGDLLPELYEAWLDEPRERLRERCHAVLDRLVDILEQQRDYRAAIRHAQRLVHHDPLVETSYRRLMHLHALSGERAKALHVYHSCASLLQRELGVEPTPETRAIYERMLRAGADVAVPSEERMPPNTATSRVAAGDGPFVGRLGEMQRLRQAWAEAAAGRPRLVLVSGDSGIGKTRLVEEFARTIDPRNAVTAATRCHAAQGALAYAPITTLLRSDALAPSLSTLERTWRSELTRLLPELAGESVDVPGPLTESWQRGRLFEAITRAVVGTQPVLIVVDDAQWADRDTLEWLHHLLRFDPGARLLVTATARTHEMAQNAVLASLLPPLEREDLLAEIELPPLGTAETAALALAAGARDPPPEVLERLHAESEGNPLFVVEMVREGRLETAAAAEPGSTADPLPLPRKLRAVIASRLERLDVAAFDLLCTAAVIGREFGSELLVRVSGQSEDAVVRGLDDLWRGRIVREVAAGHYDFSHDKLREVAYGELSLTRRQLLHRYVAEALEALHADDLDRVSGQIAHHYDRAANAERAITYHRRAGDVARRLYANDDAVASYVRASTLLESLPPSEALATWRREMTVHLCEGLGAVSALSGDHEGAREQYRRALEHLAPGSRIRRARLLRSIGFTWAARYDWEEALAAFRSAERALGRAPAGEEAAWWQEWMEVLLARCGIHYWQHDWIAIERLTERVEGVVERYATARQRCMFFRSLAGMAFVRARFAGSEAALAYERAALAAALESGDARTIAGARFGLGMQFLWSGGIAEAEAELAVALASAERTGDVLLRTRCLTYLAFVHRMHGDLDATERYAEECLRSAAAAQMPEYEGAAHGHLSWRSWRRGDLAGAERAGRAALEAWRSGQSYPLHWCALLPLLATAIARGRMSEALESAAALLDPSQQRLPDDLNEALNAAVEAAEGGDSEAVAQNLGVAVSHAEHARYL